MKKLSLLLGLIALLVPNLLASNAPSSLNGLIFTVDIESGSGDFASSGQYLFIPDRSGSTYNIVFITDDDPSSGTFTYARTGENTATLSITDSSVSTAVAQELSFNSDNTGSYSITNGAGTQTGTFTYEYIYNPSSPNIIDFDDLVIRAVGDDLIEFQTTLRQTTDLISWDDADIVSADIDGNTVTWSMRAPDPSAFFRILSTAAESPGQIDGIVKDAVSGSPISGATIRLYSETGALIASGITGDDGAYSLNGPAGEARIEIEHPQYVDTELFATLNPGAVVEADVVLFASDTPGVATISGTVINSLNGDGVAGATVHLAPGINNRTQSYEQSTTADSSGNYSFSTVSGSYTLTAQAENFATSYANAAAVGGIEIDNQDIAMSPGLNVGEWRIVLSWGQDPSDLDSHLYGPKDESGNFHIYWSNKTETGTSVNLDLDDVSSYGPETITIPELKSGTYRYWVHDYSNRNSSTSTEMSNQSAAKVIVWTNRGDGTVKAAEYNVPSGSIGNAWIIFEIDGSSGTIITRQEVTNIGDDDVVPLSEKPNGAWTYSASQPGMPEKSELLSQ